MDTLSNHIVDYAVLGTILLSGIFAFARGFVRECLALVSWIIAIFAAMHFSDGIKRFLEPHIHNTMMQNVAAEGIVFVCVLTLLSVISYLIAKFVRTSALSAVDRSLGFLFGAARGFLIVCLVYMLGVMLFPIHEKPDWLKSAKTEPLMAAGSNWLEGFIPPDEAQALRERLGADSSEDATAAVSALSLTMPVKAPDNPANTAPAQPVPSQPATNVNPDGEIGRLLQQQQDQAQQPHPQPGPAAAPTQGTPPASNPASIVTPPVSAPSAGTQIQSP